ncbi:hypothetical protein L5515_000107 [Caenorhabditis briggsae]|uniref:Uncharacterized protein n=1 Tax=Caenorhabditis briggsae TaxID=6238 RepID=A0AAE9E1F1_CAEBR|nr:hypothetical protein L5515_000107 [Caenorhabditis briggsae]
MAPRNKMEPSLFLIFLNIQVAAGSQNQPQSFHAVAPPQYYSMYSIHQPQPMMPGTPQSAPHPTVGPQSEQQPKQPANPTQGQPILYQQTPHGFVPVQWQPQNPYSMMPCDVPQMPFYFPQYPAARDPELPLPRFNGDSHDYYGFLHSFTARFDNASWILRRYHATRELTERQAGQSSTHPQ